MNSITRLSIVPFLILCISVLGCAVFPGQQEEVTFPRKQEQSSAKQEQSSAKIIMPTDDQPVQIQSGQSADEQKLSAVFRGLPSLTNESFDSQFSTQQNPSLVPDGLLSNEANVEPARNKKAIVQAEPIEFAQDNVPFGSPIRTAARPITSKQIGDTQLHVDDRVRTASLNVSNNESTPFSPIVAQSLDLVTVSDELDNNTFNWEVRNRGRVRVPTETIRLVFNRPTGDTTTTKIQIKVGDKFVTNASGELDSPPAYLDIAADYNVALNVNKSNQIRITGFANDTSPDDPTISPFFLTVVSPSDDPTLTPEITDLANGIYAPNSPFNDPTATVTVYSSTPYLRILGQIGTERTLQFVHVDETGNVQGTVARRKVETAGSWGWVAELKFPELGRNKKGKILVLRSDSKSHSYAANAIEFQAADFTVADTDVPIITRVASAAFDTTKNYTINETKIALVGENVPQYVQAIVTSNLEAKPLLIFNNTTSAAAALTGNADGLKETTQKLTASFVQGDKVFPPSKPIEVTVRTNGPKVASVNPSNFGTAPGITDLTIRFDPQNKIVEEQPSSTDVEAIATYFLLASNGSGGFSSAEIHPASALFDSSQNTVTLTFTPATIPANVYQLNVVGANIQDVFGNLLEGESGVKGSRYKQRLGGVAAGQFVPDDSPSVRPGISGSTGEFVPFPEFVRRPDVKDGFNPNDKVETRVVRLYYYRDAHRIAQIVNRKVRSFNRAAVDTNRQLADKARNQASERTIIRQNAERNAILKANKTRQQENQLQQAENSLNGALQQLTSYRQEKPEADPATDPMIKQFESLVNTFSQQANTLQSAVQDSRDEEVQANEQAQQAEAQEKLAREEQFRREVAAAHTDPDTYAPGKLDSVDPVEQVSVSVVGEGLIQLRGPLKGINLIRTAIDQLDSPVGQVRISLHTIQINGEHADRMEVVAKKVQTYIDHARFLTMQSSEMLRKAVVQVASQKAEEASALFPGATQQDRDERYIMAFFGKDFIDELKAMDSEFLHTGNKLLSLHSMDTTSLASALNLMALAKNSTRQEIFAVFDGMCQTQLPQAEQNYFAAGWTCPKKKKKHLFHRCKDCEPEYCPMACNARFESLRGFFDMQISNDDTMTPLQREFIRLAQIFKSRLITELEYKQRVMERAIIEERLGNRNEELLAVRENEKIANDALRKLEESIVDEQVRLIALVKTLQQIIVSAVSDALTGVLKVGEPLVEVNEKLERRPTKIEPFSFTMGGRNVDYYLEEEGDDAFVIFKSDNEAALVSVKQSLEATREKARRAYELCLRLYEFQGGQVIAGEDLDFWNSVPVQFAILDGASNEMGFIDGGFKVDFPVFTATMSIYDAIKDFADPSPNGQANVLLESISASLTECFQEILSHLVGDATNLGKAYNSWLHCKTKILQLRRIVFTNPENEDPARRNAALMQEVKNVDEGLRAFLGTGVKLQFAKERAKKSRRPLDHKKFLDMLVDDLEEKYIELLDGTRAQVANIDNYLKRVTTALDDDFNTQFYYPAFKYIREANVSYDVQFGQFETTTLLANNREFAKADPSATMEFDLPKRDILLKEGIDGAKAMMNDVGALANDSSFLAMAKLNSPNSGASPNAGSTGGSGVVRSVLPGLGGSTDEQVMSQNSNGGQQFGSNLENLIPDPAIYKFETGTGFEIRPVIQPDGQAVVFDFNYMYTTQVREPVRADEKHLGRVKRHYVDTDVQLSNFELREVSRYTVALKAARTAKGVPLFEDIPGVGVLFRPLPSDENSLQQNLIMAQATIFPTLFDLMGLRWASVVSDLDPMALSTSDFIVRNRRRMLENRVYDESSAHVDDFLRVPEGERRMDLYRSQETVPYIHPNGYSGPGMNLQDSQLQEGYQPNRVYPAQPFVPTQSIEGSPIRSQRRPSDDWYFQNGTSASPDPNGIRGPGAITPLRGR